MIVRASKRPSGRSGAKKRGTARGASATPMRARTARAGDHRMVAAVDRAARILLAFSPSWDFLTLPEIARRAGLSKPTAFRILATLVAHGLIFQNAENGTYGLGFMTLRLADVVLGDMPIVAAARPLMRQIRDKVNETVVLSIRDGDSCYYVDCFETTQSIGQTYAIGVATPLHAVAPGRAILAALPDDQVSDYVRRMRRAGGSASNTMTGRALLREIGTIRRDGYAVSSGELRQGGHTIAIAIPGPIAATQAALHISFPQGRFTNKLQEQCIDALRRGISDIAMANQPGSVPIN
jgi:DNA-binding IclR family transcriptional regulator